MKKLISVVMVSGMLAVMAVGVVQARGKFTTTISIHGGSAQVASLSETGEVSFDVTRSDASNRDTIWVTNKCFDADGTVVSKVDGAVRWGTSGSLEGIAGPFTTGGEDCMAYTTTRPWQDRVGDAVVHYAP